MALIRKLRGRDIYITPSKEPEVEEEEKTTPEDSPLLLSLESYPDFEDSENRIVLITPGSQTSLHTPHTTSAPAPPSPALPVPHNHKQASPPQNHWPPLSTHEPLAAGSAEDSMGGYLMKDVLGYGGWGTAMAMRSAWEVHSGGLGVPTLVDMGRASAGELMSAWFRRSWTASVTRYPSLCRWCRCLMSRLVYMTEVARSESLYSVFVRKFSGTLPSVMGLKFGVYTSRGPI